MTKTIGSIPVKSRVPLAAWAFAGLLTLFSLLSSLVNVAVGPDGHLSGSASKVQTSAKEVGLKAMKEADAGWQTAINKIGERAGLAKGSDGWAATTLFQSVNDQSHL